MLFIDGIATQKGMVKALEDRLQIKVTVPHDCKYVCAIGAALLGLKRLEARAEINCGASAPSRQEAGQKTKRQSHT